MAYRYHTEITSRNHSGPRGVKITGITWHHWGEDRLFNDSQDDDEARGIAKYLSRTGGTTSAHLVVSGDDVYQIVADRNYAWHAGNTTGNRTTIGIEVDPDAEKQDTTYATLAELVRDLEKHHGRLRFYRHRDWKNTACPGDLDIGRIRRMADSGKTTTPAKSQEDDDMNATQAKQLSENHNVLNRKLSDGDGATTPDQIWERTLDVSRRTLAAVIAAQATPARAEVDVEANDVADALIERLSPSIAQGVADALAARLAK